MLYSLKNDIITLLMLKLRYCMYRLIGVITAMNKKQVLRFIGFMLCVVLLVGSLTYVALQQPDFAQTQDRLNKKKKFEDNTPNRCRNGIFYS